MYIAASLIGDGELLVTVQVLLDSWSFFGLYYWRVIFGIQNLYCKCEKTTALMSVLWKDCWVCFCICYNCNSLLACCCLYMKNSFKTLHWKSLNCFPRFPCSCAVWLPSVPVLVLCWKDWVQGSCASCGEGKGRGVCTHNCCWPKCSPLSN